MKGILFFLLMIAAGSTSAQPSGKPVLAFGPWYTKKVVSHRPDSGITPIATELAIYQPDEEVLNNILLDLRKSNNDSLWQFFNLEYENLTKKFVLIPHLEPFVIKDEFLHKVVMQASRHRRTDIALRFIDEAKRIHPNGIYRTDLNCKH